MLDIKGAGLGCAFALVVAQACSSASPPNADDGASGSVTESAGTSDGSGYGGTARASGGTRNGSGDGGAATPHGGRDSTNGGAAGNADATANADAGAAVGGTGGSGITNSAGSPDAAGEGGAASGGPLCAIPEEQAPPLYPPTCEVSQCGNGVIDSCVFGGYLDVSEPCDGVVGTGANCDRLGYASGSTTCTSNCYFDPAACMDCLSTPSVLGCAHPVVGKSLPTGVGLASHGGELGLAWVTTPSYQYGSEPGALRFARLRPDLSVISESTCLPTTGMNDVQVVSTSDGWWLAADRNMWLDSTLVRLSAAGVVLGIRELDAAWYPSLAPRTGGGALLTYFKGSIGDSAELWAEVLDAHGVSVQPAVRLLESASALNPVAAIAIGDSFLVGATNPASSTALTLIRVGLDGVANTTGTTTGTTPLLAWNGQNGLMLFRNSYRDSNQILSVAEFAQNFDSTGTLLGTSAMLPASDEPDIGPLLPTAAGFSLLTHYPASIPDDAPYTDHLFVTRLDAGGVIQGSPDLVDLQPEIIFPAMTTVGSDLAIALLGRSYSSNLGSPNAVVTVARVHPL